MSLSVGTEAAVSGSVTGAAARPDWWKWAVCMMLLAATMINYMDRMALNQMAPRMMSDLGIDEAQYGYVESAFAVAFATGAILGGFAVDRFNVWWVYPIGVFAWSLAGAATGLVETYPQLLVCRFLLGLSEAVHWPCALRTTQRILSKEQRTLGNSILQSGAAIGAVLTPLVVVAFLQVTNDWQPPFVVIGALGLVWVAGWLWLVRPADLALPGITYEARLAHETISDRRVQTPLDDPSTALRAGAAPQHALDSQVSPTASESARKPGGSLLGVFTDVRFLLLILTVVCINSTWHFFRAWMPLFLQKSHGYSETGTQYFSMAYYLMTDLGSLAAGFGTIALSKRGFNVFSSRMAVFGGCVALTVLSLLVAQLDAGPLLLAVLLLVGFGALGLFPVYYSFSQDLTEKHQGKLTGTLGCANWLMMALLHSVVGNSVKATGSYDSALAMAGVAPLLAFVALLLFWRDRKAAPSPAEVAR